MKEENEKDTNQSPATSETGKPQKEDAMKRYELIFAHFKLMEGRYHTWMNYYSLFNGALLVAFCTILVCTGKVVELNESMPIQKTVKTGVKVFWLVCTYWDFLRIIAILGGIASYCWYLSIIGHYKWVNNWRYIMKEEGKDWDKKLFFDRNTSLNCCYTRMHWHSTYKVTKCFILSVLLAWICIAIYSFTGTWYSALSWGLRVWFILIGVEYFLHPLIGSDLSQFENKSEKLNKLNFCTSCKEICFERLWNKYGKVVLFIIIGIIVIIILFFIKECIPDIKSQPTDYKLNIEHKVDSAITEKGFIRFTNKAN